MCFLFGCVHLLLMFKKPTVTTLQWSIICFTYACNLSQTTIILPFFTHCKREEAKKEQQRLTEVIFKACFFTTKRHKKVANPLKGKSFKTSKTDREGKNRGTHVVIYCK
ncbi:hypothetical protein OIU76_018204 [Salix suchowensis]|nr:hypothetical protein OIU76_018204 [Salix suchowensis]KAJ6342275.1 hypothetical protein OIU78_010244 [Salix suchowensis]